MQQNLALKIASKYSRGYIIGYISSLWGNFRSGYTIFGCMGYTNQPDSHISAQKLRAQNH